MSPLEHAFTTWAMAVKELEEAEMAVTRWRLGHGGAVPPELIAAADDCRERSQRLFVRACVKGAYEAGQTWHRVWALQHT